MVRLLLVSSATVDGINELGATALMWATSNNHVDVVRMLMDAKASVHATTNDKTTLLMCAARVGAVDVARELIDAGADISAMNDHKMTALRLAADNGRTDMLQMLMSVAGASERSDPMLVMCAARSGCAATLRLLMDAKASLDVCDDNGLTPLMASTERGGNDTTVALLKAGVAIDAVCKNNKTALCWAAHHGNAAAAQALIEAQASLTHRASDGMDALARATSGCHHAVMQVLINAKADVKVDLTNGRNPRVQSPLQIAVKKNDCRAARMLINAKAAPNYYDDDLLWCAISNQNDGICELLVEAKAEVNAEEGWPGPSYLSEAAEENNVVGMKLLIKAKAALEPSTRKAIFGEFAPLMVSIKNNNKAAVRLLLDAKARVDGEYGWFWASEPRRGWEGRDTKSLMTCAVEHFILESSRSEDTNMMPLLRMLIAAKAPVENMYPRFEEHWHDCFHRRHFYERWKVVKTMLDLKATFHVDGPRESETLLQEAVWLDQGEDDTHDIVSDLLKYKASPEFKDGNGWTALMIAIQRKNTAVVQLLVEAEETLKKRDRYKNSLTYAIMNEKDSMLRALIDARAPPDVRLDCGGTALHRAVYRREMQLAHMFLNAKANVDAKDEDGRTPLIKAVYQCRETPMIQRFLDANASLTKQDKYGNTALMYAVKNEPRSDAGLVRLLLESAVAREMVAAGCEDNDTESEEQDAESGCDEDEDEDEEEEEDVYPQAKRFKTV